MRKSMEFTGPLGMQLTHSCSFGLDCEMEVVRLKSMCLCAEACQSYSFQTGL